MERPQMHHSQDYWTEEDEQRVAGRLRGRQVIVEEYAPEALRVPYAIWLARPIADVTVAVAADPNVV